MKGNRSDIFLLAIVILLSRIPFLFSGYGSEEDAWGLILVARNISLTGIYEVSRLPGHPVQELLLSLIWDAPSWLLNLLTAIVSTAGVVYFMLALKANQVRNYMLAGIFLAFTPAFYINSTNLMDYTWALSLVMASFYYLTQRKLVLAAVILGIACGFRITAGAMVIPFAILLWQDHRAFKKIFLFSFITTLTAILCFIPAFNVYGSTFFTFYEYFPYPPFLKNIYKGTIGAWGVPGTIVVFAGVIISVSNYMRNKQMMDPIIKLLLAASLASVLLYTYSFLRIPQKSAFVIPVIPFIAIIFSVLLSTRQMKIVSVAMIISCFFAGIHLDDPLRGSKTSMLAWSFEAGKTPVAFDLLNGPVSADLTKRQLKISYAKNLVDSLSHITVKTSVIAGWWQNELKYFALQNPTPNVSYLYYADEKDLRDSIAAGNKLFYLPEQDIYNDIRFGSTFTKKLADPF